MKHKRKSRKDQISLTSSESSTEPLRLQIKAKLNSLFDGFVSDLQTISQEAEPDFSELLDSHVSQFVNGNNHNGNASSSAPSLDHSLLQNFVNSAKSRLSDLLNQEKNCVSNGPSKETAGKPTKALKKSGRVDPLQTHISQKVQSLLCKALDVKLANGTQAKNHSDSFIDSELEGFTSVLQNFVNSAKRKISLSLSNGQSPQLPATSRIVGAKKSELCDTVSASPPGGSRGANRIDPFNSDSGGADTGRRNSRKASLRSSSKMYSPCDIDCLEEVEEVLCIPDARNCRNATGGMLLLEDAERAPEFLDIEINTDVEDSSDEDVIVLGEKRPTYEEITLEEDDDEDDDDDPPEKKEGLFKCPQCEKAFRVESLLKFHVRMHGGEEVEEEGSSSLKRRSNNEEERPTKVAKNLESSIGKDKENQTNPNTSSPQSKKSLKPGRRKQTSKH